MLAPTEDTSIIQPGRNMDNYGSIPTTRAPRSASQNGDFLHGSQTCPTCRGTGRIARDEENELVALIPVRDKRLKPRRTTCYVLLAVTLCAITAGLLMFFLLPRSVEVSSHVRTLKPMTTNISVLHQYVLLSIRNQYNITNNNFFPVTVTKMEVRVLFDGKVMADTTNATSLAVPIRSTALYNIDFNITFTEDLGYLAYFCDRSSEVGHTIWMPFQATATTSYYGHTEDAVLNFIQQVRCSGRSIE